MSSRIRVSSSATMTRRLGDVGFDSVCSDTETPLKRWGEPPGASVPAPGAFGSTNSLYACRVVPRTCSEAIDEQERDLCNGAEYDTLRRPEWRNGRRAALKMQYRKVCGFESHLGHFCSQIDLLETGGHSSFAARWSSLPRPARSFVGALIQRPSSLTLTWELVCVGSLAQWVGGFSLALSSWSA